MKFLVVSEGWENFNTFTNKWEFGNPYLVIKSLVKLSVCVCVCVCVGGRHILYAFRDWKFKDLNRKISDCRIVFTQPCDL